MKKWSLLFPLGAGLLALLLSASFIQKAVDPSHGLSSYDLDTFARLPVQADGRVKPMDSVARNSLRLIHGKTSLELPKDFSHEGNQTPEHKEGNQLTEMRAITWLLQLQMLPEVADHYPVFRIDHDQILGMFGWQRKDQKYFSYQSLKPHMEEILERQQSIAEKERSEQNVFEQQLLKLGNAILRYRALGHYALPAFIPPGSQDTDQQDWHSLMELLEAEGQEVFNNRPAALYYRGMIQAYHQNKPEAFNKTVAALKSNLDTRNDTQKVDFEVLFNRLHPFLQSEMLYVLAFVFSILSWLFLPVPLRNAALALLTIGLLWHTFGLGTRMYLQGRPPVTNLYSSAVFVGWAAVILGLILEKVHRNSIGNAVAAICGFTTLLIAPALSSSPDTLEMMQAVLDSNFWLATHVVVISLGYSAMFLAGFLAILYLIRGLFTRSLDRETARSLNRMVYAIICFAMLFSFVGTMLGGIWADQSWGRFWGWDPKENGALLIVLWCAIALHAGVGGFIKERGLMALAVGGNIITSWSWFGTNMLGVGLHSYGFADKQFVGLAAFILLQLVCIGLFCLPKTYWRSGKIIK